MGSAPGGLHPSKEHKRALAQLTQPMPVQCWQLNRSKRFNQESWTWTRCNPFNQPVEASRPRVDGREWGRAGRERRGGRESRKKARELSIVTCVPEGTYDGLHRLSSAVTVLPVTVPPAPP